MSKIRKKAANPKEKDSEQEASKAVLLASELIMSASDSDVTADESVTLLCGKPPKGKFFMVHPTVRVDVRILKQRVGVKDERYVVTKSVAAKLDYVSPNIVFLCTTMDGVPFLWLVGLGDDSWSDSARRIAVAAMAQWVRLVPHNHSGTYHKRVAKHEEQKPDFKGLEKKAFSELLLMAFDEDHIISSLDHPVAKQVFSGE
jgi:hypothetical protein